MCSVAETCYSVKSVRNRLAALAAHGQQNCKQSGVVLERTVNRRDISTVTVIHVGIHVVINRKGTGLSNLIFIGEKH